MENEFQQSPDQILRRDGWKNQINPLTWAQYASLEDYDETQKQFEKSTENITTLWSEISSLTEQKKLSPSELCRFLPDKNGVIRLDYGIKIPSGLFLNTTINRESYERQLLEGVRDYIQKHLKSKDDLLQLSEDKRREMAYFLGIPSLLIITDPYQSSIDPNLQRTQIETILKNNSLVEQPTSIFTYFTGKEDTSENKDEVSRFLSQLTQNESKRYDKDLSTGLTQWYRDVDVSWMNDADIFIPILNFRGQIVLDNLKKFINPMTDKNFESIMEFRTYLLNVLETRKKLTEKALTEQTEKNNKITAQGKDINNYAITNINTLKENIRVLNRAIDQINNNTDWVNLILIMKDLSQYQWTQIVDPITGWSQY